MIQLHEFISAETELWPSDEGYCGWSGVSCNTLIESTNLLQCRERVNRIKLPCKDNKKDSDNRATSATLPSSTVLVTDIVSLAQQFLVNLPCLRDLDISHCHGIYGDMNEALNLISGISTFRAVNVTMTGLPTEALQRQCFQATAENNECIGCECCGKHLFGGSLEKCAECMDPVQRNLLFGAIGGSFIAIFFIQHHSRRQPLNLNQQLLDLQDKICKHGILCPTQ